MHPALLWEGKERQINLVLVTFPAPYSLLPILSPFLLWTPPDSLNGRVAGSDVALELVNVAGGWGLDGIRCDIMDCRGVM